MADISARLWTVLPRVPLRGLPRLPTPALSLLAMLSLVTRAGGRGLRREAEGWPYPEAVVETGGIARQQEHGLAESSSSHSHPGRGCFLSHNWSPSCGSVPTALVGHRERQEWRLFISLPRVPV